jgi:glucosamine-phosphate N-acetyltransferase
MEIRKIFYDELDQYELLLEQFVGKKLKSTYKRYDGFFGIAHKHIYVVLDNDKMVAAASLIFESKQYHINNDSGIEMLAAYIQDVIVDKDYRGRGIGKQLIEHLVQVCRDSQHVYKIMLTCSQENVKFYEKCGFGEHEISMRIDL